MEQTPRRELVGSEWTDDEGAVDPRVAAALGEWQRRARAYHPTLAVVATSRLLAPVVAVLGEVGTDERGLAVDKSSDMAAVLLQRPDGRKGMLAFTGLAPLNAWDPQARPVPVSVRDAARSAVQDGAVALVLDVAGPVQFVIEGDDLLALARGWRLVSLEDGQWAWLAAAEDDGHTNDGGTDDA